MHIWRLALELPLKSAVVYRKIDDWPWAKALAKPLSRFRSTRETELARKFLYIALSPVKESAIAKL